MFCVIDTFDYPSSPVSSFEPHAKFETKQLNAVQKQLNAKQLMQ